MQLELERWRQHAEYHSHVTGATHSLHFQHDNTTDEWNCSTGAVAALIAIRLPSPAGTVL